MNLFSFLFKPKEDKLPGNDFFQITSRELMGDLEIVYGRCRKKIVEKDLPSLTKIFQEARRCAVSLSIDQYDSHILKAIFMRTSPIS